MARPREGRTWWFPQDVGGNAAARSVGWSMRRSNVRWTWRVRSLRDGWRRVAEAAVSWRKVAEEGAGQTEAFGGAHLCGWKQGGREGVSLTAGVAQGNRSQVRLEGSSAGHFSTLGGVGVPSVAAVLGRLACLYILIGLGAGWNKRDISHGFPTFHAPIRTRPGK